VSRAPVGGITVTAPTELEVSTLRRREPERLTELLALGDAAEEVGALFESGSDPEEDADFLSERGGDSESGESSEEEWCDSAIDIAFEQGWRGRFAVDDMLNVVVATGRGFGTDERFSRSIRPGDRVLLIHGSRRQNLYDLIVERVHRHPAIELHLALLRRWREDFQEAVHRWHPRTLDELLQQLRERGSRLTSSGTLYHWLRGWTLCPQDSADIVRAAEVLNMPFLQKNHSAVAKAARRVRGLHIGLSIRLGRWLTEPHGKDGTGAGEDFIDESLGLTFSDFKNSIVVVAVETVTAQRGPFLRSGLGRVSQETK
jgi:hypothetical protein